MTGRIVPHNKEGFRMLYIYPACFFKEKGGYSVVFPDLNWLATSGKTESEATSA